VVALLLLVGEEPLGLGGLVLLLGGDDLPGMSLGIGLFDDTVPSNNIYLFKLCQYIFSCCVGQVACTALCC
jgi:hypothetical protein